MADLKDPLFKGATRPVLVAGVPIVPLVLVCGSIFIFSIWLNFFVPGAMIFIITILPVVLIMRHLIEKDDQMFRLLGLRLRMRFINKAKTHRFWGASTYSPLGDTRRKRK